jgi:phosphatidylserine/phosphatidylglycerophosphate/cardiolipin synthase-like enzyme
MGREPRQRDARQLKCGIRLTWISPRRGKGPSLLITAAAAALGFAIGAPSATAADQVYFSANTNVTNILVNYINHENVRLDISSWYLSEHAISIAIANRFAAGVRVRVIGDRAALFEADPHTKTEFYYLANRGVPIRLRFNPTNFPEIDHWKAAIFVGQNIVEFGSGNFAPTELAPVSATNYDDDSELFTDDPQIVNAFKTKFDQIWNDTTVEPRSRISSPPYLKDWYDACASEPTGNCRDFATLNPNPAPMVINTSRLEADNPTPPDLYWGQGPDFNNRLLQEINNESREIDLIVYRLEVASLADALLQKFRAGVAVKLMIDPAQYTDNDWPEYWLTHAYIDKLYAAGIQIRQRTHAGVTHMKTLITSTFATNASSNFAPNWQRDHDYFVSAATKPAIYQAFVNEFKRIWADTTNYGPMVPTPPRAPSLVTPASGASGVAVNGKFVWNTAPWAVSYNVYLGTTSSNLALVANVPAQLVQNPPTTYSWTPSPALNPGTTYYWKIVSLANATPVNSSMVAASAVRSFSTSGSGGGSGGQNLLQQPGFEGYNPPALGLPGWVSDSIRKVAAKSETNQPHSGAKNGACWTPTSGDCGIYQEVTAPATGQYTLVFWATADRTGGWVGANVNGQNAAGNAVSARGFGNYAQYTMTFQAAAGSTIRVWMYSPSTPGYVVIDDVSLTTP